MGTIKSISLTETEANFIEINEISPTALVKQAIRDAQDRLQSLNPDVSTAKKLEIAQKKLTKVYEFVNSRGLFDDFLVWKEKRDEE